MYETNFTDEMSQKINRYLYLMSLENIEKYNRGYLPDLGPINEEVLEDGKTPVWVCWWQGLDNAPEVVKRCVESIERNIPRNKAKLIVITLDNYMNYIGFSETIVNRFNSGAISLTHLSDILRMQLLYMYGGMWIDATYFISDDRIKEAFKYEFYTVKAGEPTWGGDVHAQGRWVVSHMMAKKGNPLCGFICDTFELYFKTRKDMLDYFLLDRFILIAYENIPVIRKMIDECPVNNKNTQKLVDCINDAYDSEKWNELKDDTYAFKLTYKQEINKSTETGEDTFYKSLLFA